LISGINNSDTNIDIIVTNPVLGITIKKKDIYLSKFIIFEKLKELL
jgi:hypothetical protein